MAINKRKVLDAARKYAQKGAQAKALKEFDKLLKLDPRDARLRLEIGDAHRRWGNADEAIETYTRVAEQYTKEGFDARAVAVYKQIHNLKPDAYDSYAPLAELYQRMGLDSEAILALQTAADGYHKEGRKSEALELLRKMATLDPTNTTSRITVADLLRQEGLTEEAVSEYEEAGAELERQGDAEAATGVYERILEVQPDRRETLVKLAETLVERGLADRAEAHVKRVLEEEPDEPARYELMAAVYRLQKRDEELADVYRSLADLHRRRGDDDQAREILQRYVPSADFEEQEIGLDDQTAFGAMDSAIALGETSQPLAVAPAPESRQSASLAESPALGSGMFDPDSSTAIDEDVLETDGDEGDYLALEDDVESVELELDEPLDPPAVDAGVAPPDSDADPEQLLAEANVYLRYGKREQAIANLEAIVARDPGHRVALEKLGETRADAGEEPQAIESWLLAAEAARAEGDFDAVAVLRDRIAAIDPEAANNLGPPVPAGEASAPAPASAEGEATVVSFDSFEAPDRNADSSTMSDSAREIDLDDIEIDIDDSEFAEEIPGLVDDEDVEAEEVAEGAATPTEAAVEGDGGDTLDVATEAGDSDALGPGASAAMVQQIGEDLEEADFYMKQGLADEAEVIYQRILSIAPNHPHALVRLGEVAALRGEDPSTSQPGISGPIEFEAGDGASASEAEESEMGFREDIPGPDDAELPSPAESLSVDEPESDPEPEPGLESEPEMDTAPESEIEVDLDLDVDVAPDALDEVESDSNIEIEADAEDSLDVTFPEAVEGPAISTEPDAAASESELEDELASQFLAEVTDSGGTEADVDPDSTGEFSSPEAPPEPAEEEQEAIGIDAEELDLTEPESLAAGAVEDEISEPEPELEPEPEPEAAEIASPDDSFVESGVDLGEAPEIAGPEPIDSAESQAGDTAESDDDASFDLAAELSDVFDDEDGNSASGLGDSGDGFESVFNEFKKGVSRTLSEDDHEAHFDLGIAYREMGLFDDAKSEFRAAMLNADREIECRHMLGLCCLEQGAFEEAVGEFERISAAADATDEQQLSAQFDLGRAFEGLGDTERARTAYEAVAEVDASFCNVRGRLEKLDQPPQADGETSSLESFDDLIADVEASEDEETAEDASDFESFGDLVSETESEDEEAVAVEVSEEPEIEVSEVAIVEDEPADAAVESDELPEPPRPRKRKKISFV